MSIIYEFERYYINYFNKLKTDFYEKEVIEKIQNEANENIKDSTDNHKRKPSNIIFDEDIIQLEEDCLVKDHSSFKNNYNKIDENKINKNVTTKDLTKNNENEFNEIDNKEILLQKKLIDSNIDFKNRVNQSDKSNIHEGKYSLIICLAMYSENYQLINSTLEGISENLEELEKAGYPNEKILIVIIQDGSQKINQEVYDIFTQGRLKKNEKHIQIHMNEVFKQIDSEKQNLKEKSYNDKENLIDLRGLNTNEDKIDSKNENKNLTKNLVEENLKSVLDMKIPNNYKDMNEKKSNINLISNTTLTVNNSSSHNYLISCSLRRTIINKFDNKPNLKRNMDILFCIKKHNRGKLDSHFWLFMGFCKKINPKHVILLDTGTIPDPGKNLANLIIPMDNKQEIAGTCGEIRVN